MKADCINPSFMSFTILLDRMLDCPVKRGIPGTAVDDEGAF